MPQGELRGDAEDAVNELTLSCRIAFGDPADLTFADCMHRLVTLDRSPRSFSRTEVEARRNPHLDDAMVWLDDVIQIRHRSAAAAPSSPVCFNSAIALAYAGWPSTLITRGERPPLDNAKRRNSFAAIRSRLGDSMNSI